MQLLSPRWSVSFGAFTLSGVPKADAVDTAIEACASAFCIPEKPDKVVKLSAPCGLFDPAGKVETQRFLDGNGNTWVGVGTRCVSNTPSPALVEAAFRALATERFGPEWHLTKKSKLSYLRKKAKSDLAARTPFRLSESGALFLCLQTGAVISIGHAGQMVAKDLVGRISELTRVDFVLPSTSTSVSLLAYLRDQENSRLPWPTGTASLSRKRGEVKESCSVRQLSWATGSNDAAVLLANAWNPVKIEVQWGDKRKGHIGLTGGLESVSWGEKVAAADPHTSVENRLGMLLAMNAEVQGRLSEHAHESEPLLSTD